MENNWNQRGEYADQYDGYEEYPVGGLPTSPYSPVADSPTQHHQMAMNQSFPLRPVQQGQYSNQYGYYSTSHGHSQTHSPTTTEVHPMRGNTSGSGIRGAHNGATDDDERWAMYMNPNTGARVMYQDGNACQVLRIYSLLTSLIVIPQTWTGSNVPHSYAAQSGEYYRNQPQSPSHPQQPSSQSQLPPHGVHSRGSSTSSVAAPLNVPTHSCPLCPYYSLRRADVTRHMRSIHTQEKPYICEGCGESFVRVDARGRHWRDDPACSGKHTENVTKYHKRPDDLPMGYSNGL